MVSPSYVLQLIINLHNKKMKILLIAFLFLSLGLGGNAQDTKPTKEQTIGYIKKYISDYNDKDVRQVVDYKEDVYIGYNTSIYTLCEIDDCKLKANISRKYRLISPHPENKVYEEIIQIDLSKVESLGYGLSRNRDGSNPTVGLITFYSLNKEKVFLSGEEKVNKITIPLDGEITDQSQIYKAFNHLRKLCGAPEPIKF